MAAKTFFISQILAVGNLIYLTSVHYSLKFGGATKSLCNISEGFNCDVVNTSVYSILLGSPISLWGVYANLILLVFGFLAGVELDEGRKRKLLTLTKIGAGLIFIVSIVMGFISMTKLGTLCLFCIFGYTFSLISLIAVSLWDRGLGKSPLENPFSDAIKLIFNREKGLLLPLLIVALPLLTLLTNAMATQNKGALSDGAIRDLLASWSRGAKVNFQTSGALDYSPSASPIMTIVEFADFQCIHCKNAAPVLHNFVRSRPDVEHIFMSFPLDGQCNPSMQQAGDGRSCKLAYANYCAHKLGAEWKLHDHIFELFRELKVSELPEKATEYGIDREAFETCVESDEAKAEIERQAKQGEKANIKGTPAFFVNGRQLDYGQSWQVLEAVYNRLKSQP